MNAFGGTHAKRALKVAITVGALVVVAIQGVVSASGATALIAPVLDSAPVTTTTTVKLTWTDPNTQESGYVVERAPAASGPFAQVGDLNNNHTTFTDTGLAPGSTEYYRVYARGKRGVVSVPSNVVSARTQGGVDNIAPSAPASVTATATACNNVNVAWSAAIDTGGSGLRGYYVWRNGTRLTPTDAPIAGTSFSDGSAAGNTAYSYTVSTVDNANNESARSTAAGNAATPVCPDTIAPAVPGGVTAAATTCSNVNVGWSAVTDSGGSGLRGYYVWRNGTRLTPLNAPLGGSSWSDSTVAASTTYAYTVSSVDNAGNESARSATAANATTPACPDAIAPSVPSGVSAAATSCNTATVNWSAVTDTGGSGLRGYNVVRNGARITTSPIAATSFNDVGLAASTDYAYNVTAVDNAGNESAQSAAVHAVTAACPDTIAPGVPGGVSAAATSCSNVNVGWAAVTDTGGSGLRGYYVWRNGARLTPLGAPLAGTSFGDATAAASTTYAYTVSAVDNAGNESARSATAANATTPACPDTIAPGVPGGVSAAATSCSNVNVGWAAVTDTGGSGVRGYYVWRNGTRLTPVAAPLAGTSFADGTVAGSTTYAYTVSAVDNAGNESAPSATAANATTPACPDTIAPGVPGGVTASATTCSNVNVSWSAVTDTGGSGLRGYYVWRNGTQLTPMNAPLSAPSFNDNTVAASTAYSYTVSAVDNAGNQSARSATAANAATPACTVTVPGAFVSAKRFGGGGADSGYAVATGSDGSVALTGGFSGQANFGGTTLTSAGLEDIPVVKIAPTGATLWVKRLGGTGQDRGQSVAIASNGDVVVAGSFTGTADFGSGPVTSSVTAGFVARYSAQTGAPVWSRVFISTGGQNYANGVSFAPNGDVLVVGQYQNQLDFGGGAVTSSFGSTDIFVARYSSTGGFVWVKSFGSSAIDAALAVASDSAGDALVAGTFQGGVDFSRSSSPCTATTPAQFCARSFDGTDDAFVLKLNPDGSPAWVHGYGNDFSDSAKSVAVDASNNVIVTGTFSLGVDFGTGVKTALCGCSKTDIYLVKLSSTGVTQWVRTMGDTGSDGGAAVAVDSNGGIALGGYFTPSTADQPIDFGGGARTGFGPDASDGFVAKYNADGSYAWDKTFGSSDDSAWILGAAIGPQNHVFAVGGVDGTQNFGGGNVLGFGARDIVLLEYAP